MWDGEILGRLPIHSPRPDGVDIPGGYETGILGIRWGGGCVGGGERMFWSFDDDVVLA